MQLFVGASHPLVAARLPKANTRGMAPPSPRIIRGHYGCPSIRSRVLDSVPRDAGD
jgi:hypothetical protein